MELWSSTSNLAGAWQMELWLGCSNPLFYEIDDLNVFWAKFNLKIFYSNATFHTDTKNSLQKDFIVYPVILINKTEQP